MKKQKDIKENVKLVLSEKEGKKGKTVIRIVEWIIDGLPTKPKIEKRDFGLKADGTYFTGKAKGFDKEDIELVITQWDEVKLFLQ